MKILKISASYICSPLCYVLNKAIMPTGNFPSRLKYCIVKPIFKKGNRIIVQIIDLLQYLHHSPRYLRN